MKKLFLYLGVIALLVAGAGDLFAGSIDYLSNQSPDYVRSFNRNASTDNADAANYNPAGIVKLADGLLLNLGNQIVLKEYTIEAGGEEYAADDPTYLLPNFYAVYKSETWAAYAGFSIPAGGGTLTYEDGISFVPGTEVELSSQYYGILFGAAYAINDMFSISLGGRYIMAEKTATAEGILDATATASGIGGIIGLNVAVSDLNIGLRYETATALEFENDTSEGTLLPDGEKWNRDLPALLGFGIAYNITPELAAQVSLDYFFITQADQGDDEEAEGMMEGYKDDYDNGIEIGFTLQYAVVPKEMLVSVGYLYNKLGGNEDTYSDFEYALDSNSICGGVKYFVSPELDLTLGLSGTWYTEGENADGTSKFNKTVYDIAIGIGYKAI